MQLAEVKLFRYSLERGRKLLAPASFDRIHFVGLKWEMTSLTEIKQRTTDQVGNSFIISRGEASEFHATAKCPLFLPNSISNGCWQGPNPHHTVGRMLGQYRVANEAAAPNRSTWLARCSPTFVHFLNSPILPFYLSSLTPSLLNTASPSLVS